MQQITIRVVTETGLVGGTFIDDVILDVPDNATPEQISKIADDEANVVFFNHCNYGWHFVDQK